MPTILAVQGVELDVSVGDWEPVRLGSMGRGFSGQPRSTVRATKRDHHFVGDVAGVPVATAEAIRGLVEGAGHSWDFNDPSALLTSSRGLLPTDFGATSDVAGKFLGGCSFDEGEFGAVWPVGFLPWNNTVLYWWNQSGTWVHYMVRRGAEGSVDGVWQNSTRTDDDPLVVSVDVSGNLFVDQSIVSFSQVILDDLVALPYAVPDEWVPSLISWRTALEWRPLPYVLASGAAFPNGAAKVLGQAGQAHRVPLRTGGVFGLGEVVDFTLMEA